MVRVGICDDNSAVRAALAIYLQEDPQLELVASYPGGEIALTKLEADKIDVLLLDVRMPSPDGPQVAQHLRRIRSSCRVIYLTSFPEPIQVDQALGGTVMGVLTKDVTPESLARAIHSAHEGLTTISANARRTFRDDSDQPGSLAHDSREQEVLDLVCKGYTNDQIAAALSRSTSSVKQIMGKLIRRAKVKTRTELVLYVLKAQSHPE